MAEQGRLSGKILGEKYLLGDLLGEGGFGAVYSARHLLLNRPQAIKMLQERHVREPKFRERFQREAQTLATLDHPHIVHIDDFILEEYTSSAYLVMPFVSEGTFRAFLRKRARPLSLEQVTRYLEQISSALDYAHRLGIVHLDLKPQNLLVHADGRLLLSDFGLAHLIKQEVLEGGSSLYHGTPQYMAPEHLRGSPDPRSDVYALGIILYEMLASRRPFEGPGLEAIMLQQLTAQPASLCSLRPDLPSEMDKIVLRALAKDASDRYQTAGELFSVFKGTQELLEERYWRDELERQRRVREAAEQAQRVRLEEAHRQELERVRQEAAENARLLLEKQPYLRSRPQSLDGLNLKRQPVDAKEYVLKRQDQSRAELKERQLASQEPGSKPERPGTDSMRSVSPAVKDVKQSDGADILGADHPRSAEVGLVYPGATDIWSDIQAALHHQDTLGRNQIAIVLPAQRQVFLWRREFEDLDRMRQDFQAQLVFIVAAGTNVNALAGLHHFAVYASLGAFRKALLSGRLPHSNRSKVPGEQSWLVRVLRNRISFFCFLFVLPYVSLLLALLSFFSLPFLLNDSGHRIFYLVFGLIGTIFPLSAFYFPPGSQARVSLLTIPVIANAFLLLYCPIMALVSIFLPGVYTQYRYLFPTPFFVVNVILYLAVIIPPGLLMASIYLYFFSESAEFQTLG